MNKLLLSLVELSGYFIIGFFSSFNLLLVLINYVFTGYTTDWRNYIIFNTLLDGARCFL